MNLSQNQPVIAWLNFFEFSNDFQVLSDLVECFIEEFVHVQYVFCIAHPNYRKPLTNFFRSKALDSIYLGTSAPSKADLACLFALKDIDSRVGLISVLNHDPISKGHNFLKTFILVKRLHQTFIKRDLTCTAIKLFSELDDFYKSTERGEGIFIQELVKLVRSLKGVLSWQIQFFLLDNCRFNNSNEVRYDLYKLVQTVGKLNQNSWLKSNQTLLSTVQLTKFSEEGLAAISDSIRNRDNNALVGKSFMWISCYFLKISLYYKGSENYQLAIIFLTRAFEEYLKGYLTIERFAELDRGRLSLRGKKPKGTGNYLEFINNENAIRVDNKASIIQELYYGLNIRNDSILGHGHDICTQNQYNDLYVLTTGLVKSLELQTEKKWHTYFSNIKFSLFKNLNEVDFPDFARHF